MLSPVSGVSALDVLTTSRPPLGVLTSQVHPDPKFPVAEAMNAFLSASVEPTRSVIAGFAFSCLKQREPQTQRVRPLSETESKSPNPHGNATIASI